MPAARLVDLQTHSTFSDGTLRPREIVEAAARLPLAAVALTDHDTVDGQAEMLVAGEKLGVEIVPGVEISVVTQWQGVDLLGYFIDHRSAQLGRVLREVRSYRDERTPKILERLAALGVHVTLEEVRSRAGGDVIGRPHIAGAIVAKGYAKDLDEAFQEYLKAGRPAYVPKERLSAADGIEAIHGAGGLAALAHPCFVGPHHFGDLVTQLQREGLDGLEVWYSEHDTTAVRFFQREAERLGLVATGGSDFHGANKPDIQLGRGRGELAVPYAVVEALKARRGRR